MLNNTIKVYGEDLVVTDFSEVPEGGLTGGTIRIGDTQGALVVNVFAKGDVSLSSNVSIALWHSDSEDGSYDSLFTQSISSGVTAKDGELLDTLTFTADAKSFLKATVISAQTNTGGVRVCLGYWPR
jgi:hypothetical protein